MRPESPALFPAFRSALTVQVLVLLLVGGGEYTVSDLVEATGAHRRTVYREVSRLEASGLVNSRTIAGTKTYTANTSAPFYPPLRDLVTVVAGPAHVLAEEFGDVGGIDFAVVFGSWASRYRGEHGPIPNDIDVLVVGSPDRDDIYDAANRAKGRLGSEVNPVIASFNRWNSDDDPLMRDVRTKPLVTVCGTVPQRGVA